MLSGHVLKQLPCGQLIKLVITLDEIFQRGDINDYDEYSIIEFMERLVRRDPTLVKFIHSHLHRRLIMYSMRNGNCQLLDIKPKEEDPHAGAPTFGQPASKYSSGGLQYSPC